MLRFTEIPLFTHLLMFIYSFVKSIMTMFSLLGCMPCPNCVYPQSAWFIRDMARERKLQLAVLSLFAIGSSCL